jgi:hypothetical protein
VDPACARKRLRKNSIWCLILGVRSGLTAAMTGLFSESAKQLAEKLVLKRKVVTSAA